MKPSHQFVDGAASLRLCFVFGYACLRIVHGYGLRINAPFYGNIRYAGSLIRTRMPSGFFHLAV